MKKADCRVKWAVEVSIPDVMGNTAESHEPKFTTISTSYVSIPDVMGNTAESPNESYQS